MFFLPLFFPLYRLISCPASWVRGQSITVADIKKFSAKAAGIPSQPEQILFKKATQHKRNGQLDLAIMCLKKANDLLPYAACCYQRSDYERLVNYLILAEKFDEAKQEHAKLNYLYGPTAENAKEYKDREEYYWILENLKNKAPKSFAAYRKMKSDNSDKYKGIKTDIKNAGFAPKDMRFWL